MAEHYRTRIEITEASWWLPQNEVERESFFPSSQRAIFLLDVSVTRPPARHSLHIPHHGAKVFCASFCPLLDQRPDRYRVLLTLSTSCSLAGVPCCLSWCSVVVACTVALQLSSTLAEMTLLFRPAGILPLTIPMMTAAVKPTKKIIIIIDVVDLC